MIYLLLSVLGALVPLSPAIYFLVTHPFDVGQFLQQAVATPASLTAWLDVVISAVTVLIFIRLEGERLGIGRRWLYATATLLVGPSLGLPLFLWSRWLKTDLQGPSSRAAMQPSPFNTSLKE